MRISIALLALKQGCRSDAATAFAKWAKNVVAGLRGISPWLEQQFDEAVAAAERSLNPPLAGA
jgi:hypothetical protein